MFKPEFTYFHSSVSKTASVAHRRYPFPVWLLDTSFIWKAHSVSCRLKHVLTADQGPEDHQCDGRLSVHWQVHTIHGRGSDVHAPECSPSDQCNWTVELLLITYPGHAGIVKAAFPVTNFLRSYLDPAYCDLDLLDMTSQRTKLIPSSDVEGIGHFRHHVGAMMPQTNWNISRTGPSRSRVPRTTAGSRPSRRQKETQMTDDVFTHSTAR